jgi:hypothetical protein
MDGLEFCRKVYAFFEQIKAGTDGTARLRLRPAKAEKRLIEELIPLARYVQARYREGRRIRVRWFSGSQSFDGWLLSAGAIVDRGLAPKRVCVEITAAVHQNDHLMRQALQEQRTVFGVKRISRDKKTRAIVSEPYVFTPAERAADLAAQIIARIQDKSAKGYPPNTVLVIYCVLLGVTYEDEWKDAVERVEQAQAHRAFGEVFLVETSVSSFSATLYGDRAARQTPKTGSSPKPKGAAPRPSARICTRTASQRAKYS